MFRLHGRAEPRQEKPGGGAPDLSGTPPYRAPNAARGARGTRLPAGLRDALQQPLSLAGGLTSAGISLGSKWFLARLKLPR